MAFNPLPPAWLPSWSEDGTDITLPIASVPELTAAEADAASGDIRKVLWALCEKLWTVWNGLATADKPAKMTLRKSAFTDPATNRVTVSYTYEFVLTPGSLEVTAE